MRLTLLLAALCAAIGTGCSCATVEPGQIGVVTNWSELQEWTYPPGWHMMSPYNDVYLMSTRTEVFEMGRTTHENAEDGTIQAQGAPLSLQSQDQLTVTMDITVQHQLNGSCAPEVYEQFNTNYEERLIRPAARAGVREVVGGFAAVDLVTHRQEMNDQLVQRIRERVAHTMVESGVEPWCITVIDVLARNIELPESIQESIAAVQRQRQAAQERELAILTQRQEAERARIEAEQQATVLLTEARSQAEANRLLAESLSPRVLESRRIDAMRAVLESDGTRTIVVPSNQSGIFLQTGAQ